MNKAYYLTIVSLYLLLARQSIKKEGFLSEAFFCKLPLGNHVRRFAA